MTAIRTKSLRASLNSSRFWIDRIFVFYNTGRNKRYFLEGPSWRLVGPRIPSEALNWRPPQTITPFVNTLASKVSAESATLKYVEEFAVRTLKASKEFSSNGGKELWLSTSLEVFWDINPPSGFSMFSKSHKALPKEMFNTLLQWLCLD